ncbi:hypothetical protein HNR46_001342 [Haloferula luteola]|uniref:Uncharacterized protein n=1 Tax=Haloferula luteola TaxID=595692 RepID=A0A840V8Q9_9BACT|nr:hypothetical protein [Haloferula luteola]MBB5351108.1 hypothetical protein [Haloferula luteola]
MEDISSDIAADVPEHIGAPPEGYRWAPLEHRGAIYWMAVPEGDDRPLMSESDLSFHTSVAGLRARGEARGQAPIEAAHAASQLAVADASGGFIEAAGQQIRPLSVGALWAFDMAIALLGTDQSPYSDQTLVWALLHDPDRVFGICLQRDANALLQHLAQLSRSLDPQKAHALDLWFSSELGRIRNLAGGSQQEAASDSLGKLSPDPQT